MSRKVLIVAILHFAYADLPINVCPSGFTYERSGVILDNTPGAARTQERQRVLAEANSVTAQSCDL